MFHHGEKQPKKFKRRAAEQVQRAEPVTLTLPDRILERLADIDADRARAIVKAVDAVLGGGAPDACVVSELRVNGEEALLTVADSQLLRSIPWLTMIEIAPGRHLLSLKDQASIEKLEVTLGDILDAHHYPYPVMNVFERSMINVLGEYGGIGYVVDGHIWRPTGKNWGYSGLCKSPEEVLERYRKYASYLKVLKQTGCAAAVYTQTTDVELEVNGLMTYDRLEKYDPAVLREINESVISAPIEIK